MTVQVPNGVVDIAVADEAEAVRVAKKYLSYFQGPMADWECADQRLLRGIIPENRLRIYDVRAVIETLADTGSVLELRRHFGLGMVTALVRIEGRPLGVIANNPMHLGGRDRQRRRRQGRALHAAVRRLRPAAAVPVRHAGHHGRPGGREDRAGAPRRAHVRRRREHDACRSSPSCCARATAWARRRWPGGSFKAPLFTVAWPTGEFGGMGLEGAVKLGYRKELAAIDDPAARNAAVRGDGRADVRARQGAQHRLALRDRRRDRPGRLAPLDSERAPLGATARAAHGQEAPARRFVVSALGE